MLQTYTIDCESGEHSFQYVAWHEREKMVELRSRFGMRYYYEPGDSYLYDVLEGGESFFLGDVYEYTHFPIEQMV